MGYTAVHTYVAGEMLSSATLNNEVVNNIKWLSKVPSFWVYYNGTYTIANTGFVQLMFNAAGAQSYCTGGGYDFTHNWFVAPRAGYWLFGSSQRFGPNGTAIGNPSLGLANITTGYYFGESTKRSEAPEYFSTNHVVAVTHCNAGDEVGVYGYANGMANPTTMGGPDHGGDSCFYGYWIRD